MNKKVALSLLSATVMASMAASAFAAPKSGLYIGGSVDKFYSMNTLFNLTDAADEQFSNEVIATGFQNLIYVDFDGKGASIKEIMDAADFDDAKKDLTKQDFEGVYASIKADGTSEGNYDPRNDAIGGETGELKVDSVSAIDAKTVEVKFNKAIDTTDGADNTLFTLSPAVAVSTATLSADGKTVTLALGAAMTNDTAYTVIVDNTVSDADGNDLSATDDSRNALFFTDHAKPTVATVTTSEVGDLKVTFNEKLQTKPAVVVNGSAIAAANVVHAADSNFVTVAKANLPAGLEPGKSYPVIVQAAADLAGNTMNLYQGTFTYAVVADAPALKSLVAKDEKTLTVEFSEGLSTLTTTEVEVYKGTTKLTLTGVTDVSNGGKTKFEVGLPVGATDVYAAGETSATLKVVVKGYKDAAGNFGANIDQNITVTKDTQGPTFVSSKYDSTANEIQLTFSETLKADAAPAASKYVITDANGVAYTAVPKALSGTAKVIALDTTDTDGAGPLVALPNGTYTVQVLAGAAKDNSIAGNDSAAATTTVTIGSGDATPGAPTVTFSESSKGVLLATFNEAVKGGSVAGSATDAANYKLNGAALPAGTTITLNTARTVATITLPADALATSQSYTLTASSVQDLAGNVMTSDTQVVALTENTTPKLLSAAYQADGTIKLTFSENLVIEGTAATADEDDFVVTVQGNELTAADFTAAAGTTAKELVFTPATGFSFATGTISVETADTTTIADADGNLLKSGANVTVTR